MSRRPRARDIETTIRALRPGRSRADRRAPWGAIVGIETRDGAVATACRYIANRFPLCTLHRAIRHDCALRAVLERARRNDPRAASLAVHRHLHLRVPPQLEPWRVAAALSSHAAVARVRVRSPAPDPLVLPTSNPEWPGQPHLHGRCYVPRMSRATNGADVAAAWRLAGGDGRHAVLVDVERGWDVLHEDLRDHDIASPLCGVSWPASAAHGTSVLGVVCALDNDVGTVGVVPALAQVGVASTMCGTVAVPEELRTWRRRSSDRDAAVVAAVEAWTRDGRPVETTAEALKQAAAAIGDRPGIILLETQTRDDQGREVPAELDADVREMIWAITTAGIAVVAVAGNGGVDLDDVLPGRRNDTSGDPRPWERDSGSILVGAVRSWEPHDRIHGSNHGSAVDVWAWGDHVRTTWTNPLPDGRSCDAYGWIGGTSAAAAVVAGIAASVRSIAAAHGTACSPRELRDMLRSRAAPLEPIDDLDAAPPSLVAAAPAPEDVLPTFPRIVREHLRVPHPYVRCGEDDQGGREDDVHGPSPDLRLRDGAIELRVHNAGAAPARDVRVALHHAPLSVAPAPWLWRPVADVHVAEVAAGGVESIAVRPDGPVPSSGSLVAVLGVGGDGPVPPGELLAAGHLRWMQDQMRAVAVHSAAATPVGAGTPVDAELPFLVCGAPDGDSVGRLAIDCSDTDVETTLCLGGGAAPANVALPARAEIPVRLHVRGGPRSPGSRLALTVTQATEDGRTLGRLVWEIAVV